MAIPYANLGGNSPNALRARLAGRLVPPVHYTPVIASFLLQAGLDRIRIPENDNPTVESLLHAADEPDAKLFRVLNTRFEGAYTVRYRGTEYQEIRNQVVQVFGAFDKSRNFATSDPYKCVEMSEGLPKLTDFLTGLFLALRRNESLVLLNGWPDFKQVEAALPIELSTPVINLFNSMKTAEPAVPAPQYELSRAQVLSFRHILDSDLFHAYVDSHACLNNGTLAKRTAIRNILMMGSKLRRRHADMLDARRVFLAITDLTAKVVDTVFGKLPGLLAERFASAADKAFKSDNRLVIYDLSHVLDELEEYQFELELEGSFSDCEPVIQKGHTVKEKNVKKSRRPNQGIQKKGSIS